MENENIDDIVSMIDRFMSGDGGHLNLSVDNYESGNLEKTTQTTNTYECASGDFACKVPTLHNGLDGEE